jgi:hypothetical protein
VEQPAGGAFVPKLYKGKYLENYESQDTEVCVLTQDLLQKVRFRQTHLSYLVS